MTKDIHGLHRFLTPEIMRDVLQAAGYRVEEGKDPTGAPVLASATGGLGFELRFANPLTPARKGVPAGDRLGAPEGAAVAAFADASLRAAFRVQGELPLSLVNRWNVTHRFARLLLAEIPAAPDAPGTPSVTGASNAWLALEMDVVALGGVLADNLRAQIEIWDRLVNQLIAWLREELPKLAKPAPVAEPAAPEAEPAPEPALPAAGLR